MSDPTEAKVLVQFAGPSGVVFAELALPQAPRPGDTVQLFGRDWWVMSATTTRDKDTGVLGATAYVET